MTMANINQGDSYAQSRGHLHDTELCIKISLYQQKRITGALQQLL